MAKQIDATRLQHFVILLWGEIMAERIYTKGTLQIRWQSDLCTHCETCWRGLPEVFEPEARPWVNLEGAASPDIVDQVVKCPSGALSVLAK